MPLSSGSPVICRGNWPDARKTVLEVGVQPGDLITMSRLVIVKSQKLVRAMPRRNEAGRRERVAGPIVSGLTGGLRPTITAMD